MRSWVALLIVIVVAAAVFGMTVSLDGDSLSAGAEVLIHDSSPLDADTDEDGVPDDEEVLRGTAPNKLDTDSDGLSDDAELSSESDPLMKDTDDDGLDDGREQSVGTDPLMKDTDGDGVSDGEEVNTYGTDPLLQDTDLDGIPDGEETRPEVETSPIKRDTDEDGLDDGQEQVFGTDPTDSDTDGDTLKDGLEALGANRIEQADPTRKDILLEVDSMDGTELPPPEEYRLRRAFRNAPVENPDGTSGITLHINRTNSSVQYDADTTPEEYYSNYKPRQFENDGYGYYHILIVNDASGDSETTETIGFTRAGTNGAVVQYSTRPDETGATTMHELGHQLGLNSFDYVGIDGTSVDADTYASVMNYDYYPCSTCDPYKFSSSEPFNDWEHINDTWAGAGTEKFGVPPSVVSESAR